MPTGGRYWRYRYRYAGKEKTLALGVFPDVPTETAKARHQAAWDAPCVWCEYTVLQNDYSYWGVQEDPLQEVVVRVKRIAPEPQGTPHRYETSARTSCSAYEAFEALKAPGVSAPGAPAAKEGFTSDISLAPLVPIEALKGVLPGYFTQRNPISQVVNTPARMIVNITQESHVFHYGAVVTTVSPSGTGSTIQSVGTGVGPNPGFNNFVGLIVFTARNYLVQTGCDAANGLPTNY